jgi:DNA-binding CsgD family transcriptional regulator
MTRQAIRNNGKAGRPKKSHAAPKSTGALAADVMPDDKFVLLCDWQGHVVWGSMAFEQLRVGDVAWSYLAEDSRELAREALARVVTLREHRSLEIANNRGRHFRIWMWPLTAPDIAVCILGVAIPAGLALLTERERECLQWLGEGHPTREIADALNIGLTTLHTHLRRCREKLGLPSSDALISYAARYCAPQASLDATPLAGKVGVKLPAGRRRSSQVT